MLEFKNFNKTQQDIIKNSVADSSSYVVTASPGSGKTAIIIGRTAYLINHLNVLPDSIMITTFTNKAASEVRQRLIDNIGYDKANDVTIGTFHFICINILKKYGFKMGIHKFNLMTTSEKNTLIRHIYKDLGIFYKKGDIGKCSDSISKFKNKLIKSKQVLAKAQNDEETKIAEIYAEYQRRTWKKKQFDYDDLLVYTVLLMYRYPDVLNDLNNTYQYVVQDESQDMNYIQYLFLRLISVNNTFIVGDDDQAIYGWRGANTKYMHNFIDKHAKEDKSNIFKMEENYRSTSNIVGLSNAFIKQNKNRIDKNVFAHSKEVQPIYILAKNNLYYEAYAVLENIRNIMKTCKKKYSDFAVLYRTTNMSRTMEEIFVKANIPYKIIGSAKFYDRKEIKDMIAFMKAYYNDEDSLARVLNTFDGVGEQSINTFIDFCKKKNMTFVDGLGQYRIKKVKFNEAIRKLWNIFSNPIKDLPTFINDCLATGYKDALVNLKTLESQERLENIDEFLKLCEKNKDKDMQDFLNDISLLSGSGSDNTNAVNMLTVHAAKGLEFDTVFFIGLNDGIVPHFNSFNNEEQLEEEARIFYVGMTRAKNRLFLTYHKTEERKDKTIYTKPSRYLDRFMTNEYINKFNIIYRRD